MRRSTSGAGTGAEWSSYSLQYPHDRLQRRIGMRWAATGWYWNRSDRTNIRASRNRLPARRTRRRTGTRVMAQGPPIVSQAEFGSFERSSSKIDEASASRPEFSSSSIVDDHSQSLRSSGSLRALEV